MRPYMEIFIWLLALIALAFSGQYNGLHFSFCPLHNLGISWCPGCGLGLSISSLLHGDFQSSWEHHWFGVPALMILVHRILELSHKLLLSLTLSTKH